MLYDITTICYTILYNIFFILYSCVYIALYFFGEGGSEINTVIIQTNYSFIKIYISIKV